MPTALSWADWRRAVADLVPLLHFRALALRGRGRPAAVAACGSILLLTVLACCVPAYLPGAGGSDRSGEIALLLPSACLGVLLVCVVSAAASAGGRELLARDHAVAYPVSPVTDHLGALLLAPVNIAWLVPGWTLLGATAYVLGPGGLLAGQVPVLAWLLTATAVGQAVAWAVEWVRRGVGGRWTVRGIVLALAAAGAVLVATGRLAPLLDHSPTVHVSLASFAGAQGAQGAQGAWAGWSAVVAVLLATGLAAVVVGAWLADAVARRPAREELRADGVARRSRADAGSDLVALLRTDRSGIWRSVPLRRGVVVLGILPGLVAVAGALEWRMVTVLPGLVASGGALLFGVNAWCLDGRGALWRDSLPASSRLVFLARAVALGEVLLAATVLSLLLAALRAGVPTGAELAAVLAGSVVVCVQVVAASLRWSVRRPFAADMRSARATPAPPLTMVGYSTRLALGTTLTGLVFSGLARSEHWHWPLVVAVPFLLFSARSLVRTGEAWARPEVRSRVVATVAG